MSEKTYGFVRLPVAWIRNGELARFTGGGNLGTSVTALKLYIVILSATRSDSVPPGAGRAQLTFDELEDRAFVSRAMIRGALDYLAPWIKKERVGRRNIYEVLGFSSTPGQWSMMPSSYIIGNQLLRALSTRAPESLAALKLYLYLVERRQRNSALSAVSYPRIREKTGIRQNDIPKAISALSGADLIRWHSSRRSADPENRGQNEYLIIGLQDLLKQQRAANTTKQADPAESTHSPMASVTMDRPPDWG